MSMKINHYLGYYFKCSPEGKDVYAFENDSPFTRIWDEGGSADINNFHIFICNVECPDCAILNDDSNTGIIGFGSNELPSLVERAGAQLGNYYDDVDLCYGVISFLN